ncbi:MAG: DinB family protein [Candidatus Bipolaricaulia bacterium]
MTSVDPNAMRYEHLIRLVRVARALEAGGYYNAAKLFWAAAFSEEIRASNEFGVPIGTDELDRAMDPDELDREIETVINVLTAAGVKPQLITALQHGRQGAREDRTIPWTEIPEVFVCRICGEIILGQAPQRCPTCGARALTLREFPPVYFLEPLPPQQVLAALASTPDEVEELINGLSEEQMAQPPRPGEWAIRNVLWHLLVAQGLLAGRVEKMLAEDNPSLESVAAWTAGTEESLSVREILKRFRISRQATVERLKELSAQDWWRTGQHEEFVQVTILQQAGYFARHERHHLPQIEAIRQAIGA